MFHSKYILHLAIFTCTSLILVLLVEIITGWNAIKCKYFFKKKKINVVFIALSHGFLDWCVQNWEINALHFHTKKNHLNVFEASCLENCIILALFEHSTKHFLNSADVDVMLNFCYLVMVSIQSFIAIACTPACW